MASSIVETDWKYAWGPALRAGARPNLSAVLPELLVGEYPLPTDAQWLRDVHGVKSVVSLQDDADLASKGLRLAGLEAAYRSAEIHFVRIPITDGDGEMLATRLDEIVATLGALALAGPVYLHCNAGMNRAPTAAIAYVHVHHGRPLEAAREFVRARRFCVPYMSVLESRYKKS